MTTRSTPDFYNQVESFIINSVAADISDQRHLSNEIGMYLLALVHCDKLKAEGDTD